jgi:HemY protein
MRALLWVLGLFAVAVGLVTAARYNNGYVLLVLPPWRAELSLNLAVMLALSVFFIAYVVVRTIIITATMPARVRAFQKRRAENRARAVLNEALINFFEGRFGRAEKAASAALKAGESPALSAMLAARAAHGMRAYAIRDRYLAKAASTDPDEDAMRLMAQAEMLLDERRYYDALDVLKRLPEKHTAALRLELRAQQMAMNWERVLALIPLLEKRRVFERPVVAQLRRLQVIESLKRQAGDERGLGACWERRAAAIGRCAPRDQASCGRPIRTAHCRDGSAVFHRAGRLSGRAQDCGGGARTAVGFGPSGDLFRMPRRRRDAAIGASGELACATPARRCAAADIGTALRPPRFMG